MSIIVDSCTLEQIFSSQPIAASDGKNISGKLVIPEYQRPYSWNENQINKLLTDYQNYSEDITKNETDYLYYLGSMILHQSEENGYLNIIDGQQRLTTLALISYVHNLNNNIPFEFNLSYGSPKSQQQIMHNLKWLKENYSDKPIFDNFDTRKINITLVITQSEDDAYRFFETQNTGGVRLTGADIIKAHHLRAVDDMKQVDGMNKSVTNDFAKKWESLGDLNPVALATIRGRYWQTLAWQDFPSHKQKNQIRDEIVKELAEDTLQGDDDLMFGHIRRICNADGSEIMTQDRVGYALRQPLNNGVNTIHYLQYFKQIRGQYLDSKSTHTNPEFCKFYHKLICELEGCGYLKELFDTCLLMYISQFGEYKLDIAAKKLFRVVYSRRVKNQKAVREASVPAFLKGNPVLDWIFMSFTPEQCFEKLDEFDLEVDDTGLDKNSVKKRFVDHVYAFFVWKLEQDNNHAENFKTKLNDEIGRL